MTYRDDVSQKIEKAPTDLARATGSTGMNLFSERSAASSMMTFDCLWVSTYAPCRISLPTSSGLSIISQWPASTDFTVACGKFAAIALAASGVR